MANEPNRGRSIGIDLGTTNSCVAVMEAGRPTVVKNAEGGRTTPSVVAIGRSGECLVGTLARRQAVTNPKNTIFSIKRFMGRKEAEVREESIVPYNVVSGPQGDAYIEASEVVYSPPEISAMILQKLKADAEAYLGQPVDSAVITVPAYFNDDQRQATKDAAKVAGLEVKRIINEPTAASLAYGLDRAADQTILVFDLGGGTFDVSVLEIGDGFFDVKSTAGDNHLGGDNFDKVIVDWLAAEFEKNEGGDRREDPIALQRLDGAAEKAKIELSSITETQIMLPFVSADPSGAKHLDVRLTRDALSDLSSGLLERIVGPIRRALADAKTKGVATIDHVVMVGGMTRMPAVQAMVKQVTGKEPHLGVDPDEVVAIGAAIQGAVFSNEADVTLIDVTPVTLGIETKGGVMTRLIERNSAIPARRSQTFSTAEDNQPSVEIHVLQGEGDIARDNKSLGKFMLADIPSAARGIPQIEVTFDIDADGIVSVSAKDLDSGTEQRIEIQSDSGLSEDDLERMVAAAEERARKTEVGPRRDASVLDDAEAGSVEAASEVESDPGLVFLCHSSDDKTAVRRLERKLRADGIRTWIDDRDLIAGQEWDQAIQQAVRAADVVLVCLSTGSVNKSGYLQKEIRLVLDAADEQPDGTLFLIPVKLEACDVPDRIRRWHWVDLYRRGGYKRLLVALRQAEQQQ